MDYCCIREWKDDDPQTLIVASIVDAYGFYPKKCRNPCKCSLLGYKLVIRVEDGLLHVRFLGYDQRRSGAFGSEMLGQAVKTDVPATFDLQNPGAMRSFEDFLDEWQIPVLYVTGTSEGYKGRTIYNTYNLLEARKHERYRPATGEEIRSIPMGANAVWMDCQLAQYDDIHQLRDFRCGLAERIMHSVDSFFWLRGLDDIVRFVREFRTT
jgi:hypothetical protein